MSVRTPALAVMVALASAVCAEARDGGQPRRTLGAWSDYVAATEQRIDEELTAAGGFFVSDISPDGIDVRAAVLRGEIPIAAMTTRDRDRQPLDVPGATLSHWRGSVLVRSVTLDELLHRVQHPDPQGPMPDDVLSMRVVDRRADQLTLAMRMRRTKIVTATYDTEHFATYRRHGAKRASSKSVSTKIAEVVDAGSPDERQLPEGEGRGFLWRMNSYWRYEEVPEGVIVELESLTLSRAVPMGLGLIVGPIIDRVARESMTRTLASVRRLYGGR